MSKDKKKLLMAYSVMNEVYENGFVKQIRGSFASDRGGVLDIDNPDATYVPLHPKMMDPKLLAFAFSQDPMVLLAKVTTTAGVQPSVSCFYDLWAPDAGGGKAWKALARDVVLKDPTSGNTVLTNPYGAAQDGHMLYLIDFDSTNIYQLGANELNGVASGDHTLVYGSVPLGPGTTANLPATAKGQAIIALKDPNGVTNIFALFIVYTGGSSRVWSESILVRLTVTSPGLLQYKEKVTTLGKNAQEIIPVASDEQTVTFLVPCYGGDQQEGTTNGIASRLDKVVFTFTNNMVASTLITGDPIPSSGSSGTYDIRTLAARLEGNGAYLLTGTMNEDTNQDWTLYRTDIATLLGITSSITLSQAVTQKKLEIADFGLDEPGNYWDIFIETGLDLTGDRLWFLRGSDIAITGAENYGNDVKTFERGYGVGQLDGINVNSVAFIAETLRQAALGLSLKRGLRGMVPVISAAGEGEEVKY